MGAQAWTRRNIRTRLEKRLIFETKDSITRFYVFDALRRVGFRALGLGKRLFMLIVMRVERRRPDNCIFS